MGGFAAVVLAGGAARRMGGADKPALPVAGRSMLERVLAAVADARPRVVVGPAPSRLPPGVRVTREQPAGAGPVAAAAAGLALVDSDVDVVALLAADLPLLTASAIATLRQHLADRPTVAGALYRDDDGRRQLLCGVWRTAALRAALDRLATTGPPTTEAVPPPTDAGRTEADPPPTEADPPPTEAGPGQPDAGAMPRRAGRGPSVRALFEGLAVVEVAWGRPGPPPWFDCDTDADLRRAEGWAR